jgi:hypothetical protein
LGTSVWIPGHVSGHLWKEVYIILGLWERNLENRFCEESARPGGCRLRVSRMAP